MLTQAWTVSVFLAGHSIPTSQAFSISSNTLEAAHVSRTWQTPRTLSTRLQYALYDDDDDDDDDEDYIDTASLGDWRNFRRNLSLDLEGESTGSKMTATERIKSVSKGNEEVLLQQNEALANEYLTGVWAHETSTPEVGGLVIRLPLEAELHRNYRHSIIGRKLKRLLDGEQVEISKWYNRAKALIEEEMKQIAKMADEEGQIDAAYLQDDASDMLSLFLDNQDTWQEVCLVLEKSESSDTSKTLVLNRPMAFKLTENLGRLVLNGAFKQTDRNFSSQKDLMRFMMAFSPECAVYVGGPNEQGSPATMIHGIPNLPGAMEISPGSKIYRGGIDAAVQGVLDGTYSPLEFRFFVGCHSYEDAALDVAVHLGKYQPIACARSVALKQCISLPKPLWHEVLELCGGDMKDLSELELLKRDDMQFQVVDETDYDESSPEYNGDDDEDDSYV